MQRSIAAGFLVLPAFLLVGGCEWLGLTSSAPANSEKARPGAERQVTVTNALPAARGNQYDASVAPIDENSSAPRIGSVVQGKGGQKAQKEAIEKEAAERDAKAREERARAEREAALKKAQDGGKTGEPKPAGPPTETAPPPASVNAAPIAPPPGAPAPETPPAAATPAAPAPAAPTDTKQ
jgi:hypothetical protein